MILTFAALVGTLLSYIRESKQKLIGTNVGFKE